MINTLSPSTTKTRYLWKYIINILIHTLSPLLFLFLWWVIYYSDIINRLLLPSPFEVFNTFGAIFENNGLYDIYASLFRVISGFVIGTIPGIIMGIILGTNKKAYKYVEFMIEFFKSLPPLSVFPIFLLFFGIGDMSKIFLAAFASFWLIIVNTISGVRQIPQIAVTTGIVFRASSFQILIDIILPASLPSIFAGLRLALSYAIIVIIVTEMFMGTEVGLGQKIFDGYMTYNIPQMYAYIIIVGVVGYLLNKIVLVIEQKIVHWAGK